MTILLFLMMLSMIPLMFIIVVMGLMIVMVFSASCQSGSDKHGCEQYHLQHPGIFPRNFLNWLDVRWLTVRLSCEGGAVSYIYGT
jgi:hypothetical protein